MNRCFLYILVVIALAACAGPAPSTPLASPVMTPTAAPIAPPDQSGAAPTATSGHVAGSSETIIVYQREGGFAGTSNKWTIYPTGRIVAGDGTAWQVPAEQVAPLFKLVETPGFASLNEKYAPAGSCNDCYTHTLTVYSPGEPKAVTFVEGADLPALLEQVLSEINNVITH